ncbi:MAG: glycosyltransferase family 9 protein [Acidobacteriota bacterium]
MGDIIHALPAVATLKHGFPGCVLTWIVHPRWSPLLESNPFIDRLIPFDRRSLKSVREAWRHLRESRYDFAVDFQGLVQSALIASVARAERIYGFHHSLLREKIAAAFYSRPVRAGSAHVVDMNLELAAAAGASTMLTAFPLPEGAPEGELPDGDFVLANPLAGWGAKQWPLENYSTLANRLRDELGVKLVLNGAPGVAETLARVRGAVVNTGGIAGLIHATRRAAAVLGIDSGPMHLAAALGKPGVAIFGPTDPARNGPHGATFTVLRSPNAATSYKRLPEPDPSMNEISSDAVFEALKQRLSARGTAAGCVSK